MKRTLSFLGERGDAFVDWCRWWFPKLVIFGAIADVVFAVWVYHSFHSRGVPVSAVVQQVSNDVRNAVTTLKERSK